MSDRYPSRPTRTILWGVFLILVGTSFLLERTGVLHYSVWRFWPLVLAFIGLQMLLAGRLADGINFLFFTAWFLAVEFHWYGLTYRNSWPLVIIAIGVGTVIGALVKPGRVRVGPRGES